MVRHAFRRGLASNLYETRERYIKVFDRTVLEAVEKVQAQIEELGQEKADR